MNKNLLIGAGMFFAVVVVGITLVSRPKPATVPEIPPIPTVESTSQMEEAGIEAREITVSGMEYSYNVSDTVLKKGEKVKLTFKNEGRMTHDLVIEELNLRTKVLGSGKSETIEFTVPTEGSLTFFCSVSNHRALGMEGTFSIE